MRDKWHLPGSFACVNMAAKGDQSMRLTFYSIALLSLLLPVVACGGGAEKPSVTPSPTASASPSPTAPATTPPGTGELTLDVASVAARYTSVTP
jgi:hypothetical protein